MNRGQSNGKSFAKNFDFIVTDPTVEPGLISLPMNLFKTKKLLKNDNSKIVNLIPQR